MHKTGIYEFMIDAASITNLVARISYAWVA